MVSHACEMAIRGPWIKTTRIYMVSNRQCEAIAAREASKEECVVDHQVVLLAGWPGS